MMLPQRTPLGFIFENASPKTTKPFKKNEEPGVITGGNLALPAPVMIPPERAPAPAAAGQIVNGPGPAPQNGNPQGPANGNPGGQGGNAGEGGKTLHTSGSCILHFYTSVSTWCGACKCMQLQPRLLLSSSSFCAGEEGNPLHTF